MDINSFFGKGLKNTVLVKANGGFSHNGPWQLVNNNTLLDRWHIGDFSSAEYTISIDLDNNNKEIVKCLVVANKSDAKIQIYSRVSTNTQLVDLTALINDSYVDVIINPDSPKKAGSKFIYTVQYFQNQNPLVP